MQRQITVVSLTTYTVQIVSGQTTTVVLGNRFYDVRETVSGVLEVRLKTNTWAGTSSGTAVVKAVNCLVMPDDPGTTYLPSGSPSFASITIAQADQAPLLYVGGFTVAANQFAGLMCQFQMAVTGTTANGSATIQIGVDLVIRDS
jgi:hypothetical protein